MENRTPEETLEEQIAAWRGYMSRRMPQALDVNEIEDRLREQAAALVHAGLTVGEAFLTALNRVGSRDGASRAFAREQFERLWTQPVAAAAPGRAKRAEMIVVLVLAAAAALAVKAPELLGHRLLDGGAAGFYARNASLFVLPLLAGYFAWRRRLGAVRLRWLALPFAAAAVFANVFPFTPGGATEWLTALHLPIALWLVVGIAHAGGRWRATDGRMEFVRFSGELFIYYVLIALGGGVFMVVTWALFSAFGGEVAQVVQDLLLEWVLPGGAAGAVIVSAWLAEVRREIAGNIAPVLARVFTPLFAAVVLAFLATLAWTGGDVATDRDVLIGFDLLLALVLGLLLYGVSAREPDAPPNAFDALQLLLVAGAVAADAVALAAIAGRIAEFGFSANKTAALGENLILLVNLGWSAWLYARFLRGRGSFAALERWQTAYLPVYALWAGAVVVLFPPVFGYA